MDFHSLTRRELQALCKRNKIPANITNVAMADALKALQIVEGLEDFAGSGSEKAPESIENLATGSPEAPRTSCRTSTRRKPVTKDKPESVQQMSRTRRGARRLNGEAEEEKKEVLDTPVAPSTRRWAAAASTRRKAETRAEEVLVQRIYSTRRSGRLSEKKAAESSLWQTGRTMAIRFDGLYNEMDKDLEKLQIESSDRLNGSDKVLTENGISGTDLTASWEDSLERIDDLEVVSDPKSNSLTENETDEDSGIQTNEKCNDLDEKLQESSEISQGINEFSFPDAKDDEAQLKNKGPESQTESEVCKRSEESDVLIRINSEKAIDIKDETADEDGGPNEIRVSTENSDEALTSEDDQNLSNNLDMDSRGSTARVDSDNVLGHILDLVAVESSLPQDLNDSSVVNTIEDSETTELCSSDSTIFTVQNENPEVVCQNLVCDEPEMNVAEDCSAQLLESEFGNKEESDGRVLVVSDEPEMNVAEDCRAQHLESEFGNKEESDGQVLVGDELEMNVAAQHLESEFGNKEEPDGDVLAEKSFDYQENNNNGAEAHQDDSRTSKVSEVQVCSELLGSGIDNGTPEFVDNELIVYAGEVFSGEVEMAPHLAEDPLPEDISNGEIMAAISFSTLAADPLPCQTPWTGQVVSEAVSSKSASKMTPARSIQRLIHVLDDKESIDSSIKTARTVQSLTLASEGKENVGSASEGKENVGSGRKSLNKTPKIIQRKTTSVLNDKENIENDGENVTMIERMNLVLNDNKENAGKRGMDVVEEKKMLAVDMTEDVKLNSYSGASLRQLRKMFKEKLHVKENVNSNGDDAPPKVKQAISLQQFLS